MMFRVDASLRQHFPGLGKTSALGVGLDLCEGVHESFGARGGRKIAIMSEVALNEHGFQLVFDPNDREPMHHLVGDDALTAPPRVDVLASLMQDRRSNPLYKEGTS